MALAMLAILIIEALRGGQWQLAGALRGGLVCCIIAELLLSGVDRFLMRRHPRYGTSFNRGWQEVSGRRSADPELREQLELGAEQLISLRRLHDLVYQAAPEVPIVEVGKKLVGLLATTRLGNHDASVPRESGR